MKRKSKMMNQLDLWKCYNLGLISLEDLTLDEQRDIISFDEAMKDKVPDVEIKQYMQAYDSNYFDDNETLINYYAKLYKVSKDILKIRISQIAKEYEENKKRTR